MTKTADQFWEGAKQLHALGFISDEGFSKIAAARGAIIDTYIDTIDKCINGSMAKTATIGNAWTVPKFRKAIDDMTPEARAAFKRKQSERWAKRIHDLAASQGINLDDARRPVQVPDRRPSKRGQFIPKTIPSAEELGKRLPVFTVAPEKVDTVLNRLRLAREAETPGEARVHFRGRNVRGKEIFEALQGTTGHEAERVSAMGPRQAAKALNETLRIPYISQRPPNMDPADFNELRKKIFKHNIGRTFKSFGWKGAIGLGLLGLAGGKMVLKPYLDKRKQDNVFTEMHQVVPSLNEEDPSVVRNAFSVLNSFAPTVAKSPVAAGQIVKQLTNLGNVADVETVNALSEIEERLKKQKTDTDITAGKALVVSALAAAAGAPQVAIGAVDKVMKIDE